MSLGDGARKQLSNQQLSHFRLATLLLSLLLPIYSTPPWLLPLPEGAGRGCPLSCAEVSLSP